MLVLSRMFLVMVILLATTDRNVDARSGVRSTRINSQSAGPFDLGAWVSAIGPAGGVYVAGKIRYGTRAVTRVAWWDGNNWNVLGDRLDNGTQNTEPDAIAVDNAGNVYVSGTFTRAFNVGGLSVLVNRVARWNVQTQLWEAMGGGVGVSLERRLAILGSDVYVGGIGTAFNPGGIPVTVSGIGRWNSTTNMWSPVGQGLSISGGVAVAVESMISTGNDIYIGGSFTTATNPGGSQVTVNNIARWDGTQWHALGQGLFYPSSPTSLVLVWTLAASRTNDIFVSGMFEEARNDNGTPVSGPIVRWDGSEWHHESQGLPLPPGVATFDVDQVIVDGSDSLCVYYYDTPLLSDIIARRNAQGQWAKIGQLAGYFVKTIAGRPGRLQEGLYAGGLFNQIYDLSRGQLYDVVDNAQWFPAQSWSSMDGSSARFTRNELNKAITDLQNTSDTITVNTLDRPLSIIIADVDVTIDSVLHANDGDLEFTLVHLGVQDTIIYQVGGSGQNFTRATLNDSAALSISSGIAPFTGDFRPHRPLTQFNGMDASGHWILRIYDGATGNTGTLQAWSLVLRYAGTTGVGEKKTEIPSSHELYQNYPNPFNPTTRIKYHIPNSNHVTLKVFDILGREVRTLANETRIAGEHEVTFDAGDLARQTAGGLASGVYFYRLSTPDFVQTKKLVLLK